MASTTVVAWISLFIVFSTISPCPGSISMDKIGLNQKGQFVDSYGRIRLFRGINSVQKGQPWFDADILDPNRLSLYRDWGFNFVRLGCMWSGVNPQRDMVNTTYLQTMENIVDQLGEYGLYSLLDMHQDIISSKFDAYDGVPRWLIDSFPPINDLFKFPFPFKKIPPSYPASFEAYFTYAVGQAFQDLYHNTSSSWKYWGDFWTKVSSVFGERKSVIGYELINEPWAGNVVADPLYMLPGYAGRYNLLPAYDYLVQVIRQVDRKTLIFYEPVTWAYYFSGDEYQGTGFDHLPGGNDQQALSVMSYHFYCWLIQSLEPGKIYPPFDKLVCDEILAKDVILNVLKDQKQFGMGLFFTEFGSCIPDGNKDSINTIECQSLMNLADEHFQSWSYWNSEFFLHDNDTNVNWEAVKSFARPYPIATAGEPVSLSFLYDTVTLNFAYRANTTMDAPTLIYLPINVHFGGRVDNISVTIMPNSASLYSIDATNNLLTISLNRTYLNHLPQPVDALNFNVTVKPKYL